MGPKKSPATDGNRSYLQRLGFVGDSLTVEIGSTGAIVLRRKSSRTVWFAEPAGQASYDEVARRLVKRDLEKRQ